MVNKSLEDDDWPSDYEVDIAGLDGAVSEEPFLQASFELLKESAGFVILAASLMSSESESTHDRNGAILCGHLVRMVKLMRTMIRSIVDDHGGDQQMQLVRQFLDSASALLYLLEDVDDAARYEAYLFDSLIAEREFLADVRRQISKRGGRKLPIEERIERSIADTLAAAGVSEEDIPARRKNRWPSAQARLELMGPVAYTAYRTGSSSIHGAWHDLVRNHLVEEVGTGQYAPNFDSATPRPQPLFAMSLVAAETVRRYIGVRFSRGRQEFIPRIERYIAKLRDADERHENYLTERARRMRTPTDTQE